MTTGGGTRPRTWLGWWRASREVTERAITVSWRPGSASFFWIDIAVPEALNRDMRSATLHNSPESCGSNSAPAVRLSAAAAPPAFLPLRASVRRPAVDVTAADRRTGGARGGGADDAR